MNQTELADYLRSAEPIRCSGVLLVPHGLLARQADIALALHMDSVDVRAWKIERLSPLAQYLGLTPKALLEDLHQLLQSVHCDFDCSFLYNMDILIAALDAEQCRDFWRHLLAVYRPQRPFILTIPREADQVFPEEERVRWGNVRRLASWQDLEGVRDVDE